MGFLKIKKTTLKSGFGESNVSQIYYNLGWLGWNWDKTVAGNKNWLLIVENERKKVSLSLRFWKNLK